MPNIPESVIEEITSRTDIIELISGYIPLKRLGANYKALCPFHNEKTASFVVSPSRQIFHCFGCGKGGNAFSFLMLYERLSFPEAAQALAKKAGVHIPQDNSSRTSSKDQNLALYNVLDMAAGFFSQKLREKEGAQALQYLKERNISDETASKFRIGYAPDKWDGLISYLRAKNISLGLIEKAGLSIPKQSGGYYDRFRNRLMVPIMDIKNRVIAFGARVLDEGLPKYINSPETQVYSKSKNLFGLNFSKEEIQKEDQAVITEGYFDMIAPFQAGIKNITASCGTALTVEQIRVLKRYTGNIVMIFDPDTAGQMATLRGLDLLIELGLNVRIASLPCGFDPDGFVRKDGGAQALMNLIKEAKDVFEYKLGMLKKENNAQEAFGMAKIVSRMLATISKFDNEVVKAAYLRRLAEELKIEEKAILAEYKKIKNVSIDNRQSAAPSLPPGALSGERMLVKLMLQEEQLIGRIKDKLAPCDFQDKQLNRIVNTIFELFCQGRSIEPKSLINHLSDENLSSVISGLIGLQQPRCEDPEKLFNDCLRHMQESKRKIKLDGLQEKIKAAQKQNDEGTLRKLLQEFQDTAKKTKP